MLPFKNESNLFSAFQKWTFYISTLEMISRKKKYVKLIQINHFFHCILITVWKYNNFPAILILRKIKFVWFQKVKNWHFNNFGSFEFWCLEKFQIMKCQKFPKFRAAQMAKMAVFFVSKWPKLILCKIWVAEKSWNFHIVYS